MTVWQIADMTVWQCDKYDNMTIWQGENVAMWWFYNDNDKMS